MPREMFVDPVTRMKPKTVRAIAMVSLVMALSVCGIAVKQLAANDVLPTPPSFSMLYVVREIALPKVPPTVQPKVAPQPPVANPNIPPTEVPRGIPPEVLRPDVPGDVGFDPNVIVGDAASPKLFEPPPPPPPAPQRPVLAGGNIRPPTRTKNVAPTYPTIAQSARVQGVVIIEAVIGADGRVMEARILRSIPLLDEAALTAVRQWEFTPTLLNGTPVPVIMTVTVQFTLQ